MSEKIEATIAVCLTVAVIVLGGVNACVRNNRAFLESGYCETALPGSSQTYWQKCK